MRERRSLALLDLAIGASAAVGPLLFVIMLVVASARSSDEVRDGRDNERYLSVRRLAALKTFERAIVPRDRVAAAPPHAAALLEGLPACARDWDGRSGPLLMFRRLFTRAPVNEVTPAERIALDLASIDQELLRFSSAQNRRVAGTLGFDGARWFEAAAAALATPVDAPGYPDRRFHVQCADLASAVSALARSNARMLAALAWRGTVVDRVAARWRSDQWVEFSARQIARSNPWAGLPGCVYFVSGDGAPSHYVAGSEQPWCMRDEVSGSGADGAQPVRVPGEPVRGMAPDDPRWSVPPSLATMLRPLDSLRRPSGALYREIASAPDDATPSLRSARHGPNRIEVAGHEVELGFSVDVTIDPRLQALAQRTAACYTGRDDVCRALDMRRRDDDARSIGHRMVEQAMVRLAAIAIVDVESGRIEALAGALSPCSEQEQDGPGRSSQCDGRIPYPIRYRPDALLNAAVFHDAMPASTIKPVMAAALLADPAVGARWLAAERAEMARSPKAVPSAQSLRGQLMRSDSARFLDRAFCADTDFSGCARTWAIASHAQRLGWNSGCANAPRDACGRRDLLFGHAAGSPDGDGLAQPPALEVAYGRLMAEPVGGRLGAPFRARSPIALDVAKVRRCAAGPDGRRGTRDDWEKCGGGVVVDIVAEGWGQGHARASPLGGAGMMAALAASANGQPARALHLVRAVRGTGPGSAITTAPASERANAPRPIERDVAEVILSGLSFGHRAGTSRLACEQVFDARTCSTMEWIAGKTGTPTFPNDERTLDDVHALCTSAAQLSARERLACGPLRPYKWYVAAYRTGAGDARWTKAVAVLVERNWVASTGRIDSAGDHGSNPAAEIALQIAGRHAGHLAWSSP